MAQFRDKVAVITGAGSGIGRALAQAFAKEGCRLALSDINEQGLEETASLVKEIAPKVITHKLDVSKREDVFAYADSVQDAYGQVDIVINNAGVTVIDTVENIKFEDFEWLMSINFWGVVYGTKAFLPLVKQSSDGYLVNISSIFGIMAVPRQSAYNAAKFAVKGFTEALRQELEMEGSNVFIGCVPPGGIKTDIVRNARHIKSDGNPITHDQMNKRFDKMAITTTEKAAETILNGMKKRNNRILIGPDARMMDRIVRWFPTSYPKVVRWFEGRGKKKKKK